MSDIKDRRFVHGHTKIKNVPIAVTPEGFWCCPSPTVFQKNHKELSVQNNQKPSPQLSVTSTRRSHDFCLERKLNRTPSRSMGVSPARSTIASEDQRGSEISSSLLSQSAIIERLPKSAMGNSQKKILSVEFGEPQTSDIDILLSDKQGFSVRVKVHRNVLRAHSKLFADRLPQISPLRYLELGDCTDVEIYVETIGLMYCKEVKPRLIKQSVSRVLRILKVSEFLGFTSCIHSCLEYLEAAPWEGEEEEQKVLSSVLRLQSDNAGVSTILKRVSTEISDPPHSTLAYIVDLVLKSKEEKGRREMKSLVLKLLRENSLLNSDSGVICIEALYNSSRNCMNSLMFLFRQAAKPGFMDKPADEKGSVCKQIALEADNLIWLLEILADRQVADEFVLMWTNQNELAKLHSGLQLSSRHLVSCITARIFVGIGKGEILPSKETRQMLLNTWLQPLINDYSWLHHGCRSFDGKTVEEGIGRTILTLPLEDQKSILLTWLGSFLKAGDHCPNLQRAFEVWWRRTFIRPLIEPKEKFVTIGSMISKV